MTTPHHPKPQRLKRFKLALINALTPLIWQLRESFSTLTGYYFLKRKFIRKVGYSPNFSSPKTANEHIQHKKIFERSPLLIRTSDKLLVRDYVVDTLGEEGRKYLVPLIGHYQYPDDIPFDTLPKQFVIKANHGSGTNLIVKDKLQQSPKAIIALCYKWLCRAYGLSSYQWAYTKINKRILIEELLLKENGDIPEDYKVHVVKGKAVAIQVDYARQGDHSRTLYDTDWQVLPFTTAYPQRIVSDRPSCLDEILRASITLAQPFDYARVDWYILGDRMYIGEITQYPGGGQDKFLPENYDLEFGQFWNSNPQSKL